MVQAWLPNVGGRIENPNTGAYYTIGNQLGEGGFGFVHECSDASGRPRVAKFAKPEGVFGEVQQRWEAECRLMQSVSSPHIIRLYDFFCYGNVFWMVMERAKCSLRKHIAARGPFGDRDVVVSGHHMLLAVRELNSKGIIHRDLHIDNILWSESLEWNALKIADFGIAKQLPFAGAVATTRIGRAYDVAPELLRAGYTTHQSDLYQIGLAMFFIHTGTEALGATDGLPHAAILSGNARSRAEQLNTPLGNFIAKLLRRSTEHRYQNAQEAIADLAAIAPMYGVRL